MSKKRDTNPHELIRMRLSDSANLKQTMRTNAECITTIADISTRVIGAMHAGHKLLLCGNGGSAADAQHIAAELVGRFYTDRNPLPALSLTVNTSTVTAVGNDFDQAEIFSRQVKAVGEKGDVLLALSTSGNSKNVIQAVRVSNQMGITTISLTGDGGGELADSSDICLKIPSDDTARIQEAHITAAHIVCELVEAAYE